MRNWHTHMRATHTNAKKPHAQALMREPSESERDGRQRRECEKVSDNVDI